jgi:hypothetical protein
MIQFLSSRAHGSALHASLLFFDRGVDRPIDGLVGKDELVPRVVHRENGARRPSHHVFGNAPEGDAVPTLSAVGAAHDQIDLVVAGVSENQVAT